MRLFFAFVAKEFLHILRDGRTTLILLVLPVVQVVLFGYALNTDVSNVKIAVFDQSKDVISRRVVGDIMHNEYFTVVDHAGSLEEVDELLRRGKIDLALIVPPAFMESVLQSQGANLQLIVDASNPNSARIAENYVTAVAMRAMPRAPGMTMPFHVEMVNRMLLNPSVKSTYSFVPGIIGLVFIIICSVMTSVSIVREKEQGSMEVLLASPLRSTSMVLAKMVPYVVFSFINLITILLLAYFVMGVPIRGSLFLLFVFSLIYILFSLSFGLLVSSMVKEQSSAIMITGIGMMLPTLLLSGLIFPLASMPAFLQWLSYGVPARWYISGLKRVMIQGIGWGGLWQEMLILLFMTVVTTLLALRNIKPRLA